MSSLRKGTEPDKADAAKMIHYFEQPVPIASYLLAIVVGNLVSRSVSFILNVYVLCFRKLFRI